MAVRGGCYLSRRRYALVRYMVFMLVLLVFGFLVKFLFPIGLDYVGIYLESLHSYIARPSNTHPSLVSGESNGIKARFAIHEAEI